MYPQYNLTQPILAYDSHFFALPQLSIVFSKTQVTPGFYESAFLPQIEGSLTV